MVQLPDWQVVGSQRSTGAIQPFQQSNPFGHLHITPKQVLFAYHFPTPYICRSLHIALMFKYTRHSLKKLETLLEELEYTVRYEKGNFNSGYCIVENRKVAVINKFYDTEGRINCLLEILSQVEVDAQKLDPASAKFYQQINSLTGEEEEEVETN